jgi:hypothetical protein
VHGYLKRAGDSMSKTEGLKVETEERKVRVHGVMIGEPHESIPPMNHKETRLKATFDCSGRVVFSAWFDSPRDAESKNKDITRFVYSLVNPLFGLPNPCLYVIKPEEAHEALDYLLAMRDNSQG